MTMVLLQQSADNLVRRVIQLSTRPNYHDLVLLCNDGSISTNIFLMASISPLISTLLSSSVNQEYENKASIMIPDICKHQVNTALNWLLENKEDTPDEVTEVLDMLGVARANMKEKNVVTFQEPTYFHNLPELPDIQSTELFDPEYMEDVEIEEEEDLALTIHSTDLVQEVWSRKGTQKGKKQRKKVGSKKVQMKKERLRKEDTSLEDNKENLKRKTEKNFPCKDCDKLFSTENQLDLHMRTHESGGGKGHICNHCGKCFKKLFQWTNHQRVHSGEKPFVCHTCGKAFSQEVTLRTHLRIHSGAKPYKCDECDEAFNASTALSAHRQWKHNEGNRPFLCSFCSKSFPTKAAVRKHETIHRPADRKHPCKICDKKFGRADHLKSHMRSHRENVDNTSID